MSVQTFLATHRTQIINAFWLMYGLWIVLFLITAVLPTGPRYWPELGKNFGTLAVVFFSLAMLPGIIRRLNLPGFAQTVRLSLMMFRRQLGIAMFIAADLHVQWLKVLPYFRFNASLLPSETFEFFGLFAISLALPLFLTSNNFSVQKLKQHWQTLHRLVYLITWLIFFHIALVDPFSPQSLGILSISLLEVTSWAYVWLQKPTPTPSS